MIDTLPVCFLNELNGRKNWFSIQNWGSRSYDRTSFKKNEYKADLKSDWMTKLANYNLDLGVWIIAEQD